LISLHWFRQARSISFSVRHYVLLAALILYILLDPVFNGSPVIATTLGSILLLAAIDCLDLDKRTFLASRWFGVLVLALGWVVISMEHPVLQGVFAVIRVLFLAFVSGALIYQTAKAREVSLSVIVGAVDGYLLLGIIGAAAFHFAESLAPGSIQPPGGQDVFGNALYLSFVTLTTLGYGDFIPISNTAKTIAILLATTGQLYIAVLIALLVGKFASKQ